MRYLHRAFQPNLMPALRNDSDSDVILKDGQLFAGQYRIGKELGRGGYGAVYLAEDLSLKRKVAIKVLHPKHTKDKTILRRFQIEAIASSRLNHASVVQVYATGSADDGSLYIAMEYVEGETVHARLKAHLVREQRIGSTKAIQITLQVARVLAAAHDKGIFHRDLKPHNLMLTADEDAPGHERVKILDFGIAKLTPVGSNEEEVEGATSTGDQLFGTLSYMAPEQFGTYRGITGLEGRMDVYALGVILYQCLAGRMPLYSNEPVQMMGLALAGIPAPLLGIDPSLEPSVAELAHLMLSKEAAERPTMTQVRDRLAHALGLSASRPEIVSIRPTAEHQAMLAPFSTGEHEEGLAATGDARAIGVHKTPAQIGATPSTAVKADKSVGELSTDLQFASEDLHLSTGRGLGQQLTGPDTVARRRSTRALALVLLGVAMVGTGGIVAVHRLILRPKQAATIIKQTPPPLVLAASTEVTSLPTVVPTNRTPPTEMLSSPPPNLQVPEPKQPKQKISCVAPSDACISGKASAAQRRSIIDALNDAEVKFCQGDRMVLTGKPLLTVRANSTAGKHKWLDGFLYTARGSLGKTTFEGEVEIKCKGK